MSTTIGRTIAHYAIEAPVSDGGMAHVYTARHIHLASLHAVNVLNPELFVHADISERFLGEGRIQAQLRHTNIVAVTDILSEPGVAALVMEFVEGEPLSALIKRRDPVLSKMFVLNIFRQVLAGVGVAHRKRVVHRDLKPANIMAGRDDGALLVKVLDFGIAKVLEEGKGKTRTNARMGTPYYMSPEQILSPRDVDARSDIFAIGVALYESLTGALPFEGETEFHVQQSIVNAQYLPLRQRRLDLSPDLALTVERAFAREAFSRVEGCEAFATALLHCAQSAAPAITGQAHSLSEARHGEFQQLREKATRFVALTHAASNTSPIENRPSNDDEHNWPTWILPNWISVATIWLIALFSL